VVEPLGEIEVDANPDRNYNVATAFGRALAVPIRANLVRIGNSRGIRIPKSLIDECHLEDTVELSVVDGSLVVRPAPRARQGWEAAFERMAEMGEGQLLDPEILNEFDSSEWEWPEGK
jgi:antitoxin MazE